MMYFLEIVRGLLKPGCRYNESNWCLSHQTESGGGSTSENIGRRAVNNCGRRKYNYKSSRKLEEITFRE